MRIASVNASVIGGGAEFVARSLHEQYLARDIDSWLLVGNVNAAERNVIEIPNERYRNPWARAVRRLARSAAARSIRTHDLAWYTDRALRSVAEPLRYRAVARGHEDFDHPGTAHLLEITPSRPDVFHFHNLHGSYFDIRALPDLTRQAAAVITLHDTWLFTGHCAQPIECERWLSGCETCPHLDRYVPLMRDASAENLALKQRVLRDSRLAFAAPSHWLLDKAERSGILAAAMDARVIPNGVDTRIFTPGDSTSARESLGLSTMSRIVMTVARDVAINPFKGFDVLVAACELLAEQGETLTVLAVGSEGATRHIGSVELRFVPAVSDARTMAEYYRAADVYVHPARAEVLPLAVLEAMACGTPVVASRVGGIPEVIDDAQNGVLTLPGDTRGLAEALAGLLGDPGLRTTLGLKAAQTIESRHTVNVEADRYLEFYEDTIAARGPRSTGE